MMGDGCSVCLLICLEHNGHDMRATEIFVAVEEFP